MLQVQETNIKSESLEIMGFKQKLLEMIGHNSMAVITGYLRYGAAGETDKKVAFVRHREGRWSS